MFTQGDAPLVDQVVQRIGNVHGHIVVDDDVGVAAQGQQELTGSAHLNGFVGLDVVHGGLLLLFFLVVNHWRLLLRVLARGEHQCGHQQHGHGP
ncbi:MAG: hypothetical protein IKW78_06195 [Prevotella sp.]|nr:hypothetical protein [Prevotella sp.]